MGKAKCFNSFQTVKKTKREGAVKSAFVKDVIINPSRNKGGVGLGDIKKNIFFVCYVTRPIWAAVLVFCGCYSKFSHTWFKTTFIFFPTILEDRSPKSFSLGWNQGFRGESSPCLPQLLGTVGISEAGTASLPSLPLWSHGLLSSVWVCVATSTSASPLYGHLWWHSGPTQIIRDTLHLNALNWITSAKTCLLSYKDILTGPRN